MKAAIVPLVLLWCEVLHCRVIVSSHFGHRGQMDLIDLQSCKDVVIEGHLEYKWLFHYQDHFFKFSILAPCTSKSPQEVAHVIIKDVISVIGAPMLLQSDNGKEFSNEVISNIANMSGMKIIRGRPRHPQSQGSVERANGVVKQLLK